MAGHSKWNNIRFRKGTQDAIKSKLYHKFSLEIKRALKYGGNTDSNHHLRAVLHLCQTNSIPKHVIDKALAAKSTDGEVLVYEIMYEKYAIIAKIQTPNKNKTSAEIRAILNKFGGNMAKCLFLFQHRSVVLCKYELDDMLDVIEDYFDEGVICVEENLPIVLSKVSDIKEITTGYFPITTETWSDKVDNIIQKLEELDGVEDVISNML